MAHGHMIPTVDMARLFARRGAWNQFQVSTKATIVSTSLNAPIFSKTIERDRQLGLDISIHNIKFPSAEGGLPEGCENLSSLTSPDMFPTFLKAIGMLQQPLEKLLEECHPSCVVADMMFPWATEAANKLGIPRRYEPHKGVDSDFEPFVVPGLPDQITLTRSQLPTFIREGTENELTKLMDEISQSIVKSYGVFTNSFVELEPAYSEHYRMEINRKTWHVGPLSLCNRDMKDKAERGNLSSSDEHECMRWLAKKNPNSVLYICFGSYFNHPAAQLLEIAMDLEASGHNFIWVIGIGVGAQEWSRCEQKLIVSKEAIEKAITQLMAGEEAEETRNRAKVLKEMARRATDGGGSSYCDLTAFLEELRDLETSKQECAAD
ncbi:hypothetical protein SADUNF_Sadunf09G0079400 [Salix dunnii]|uniref:Uncharacterized protein n=1 Tax=Salix dunnii TaxID=1413687 RepID=A0A835JY31_9ROSI|nr:hypothetical protein SADUNF_Sadunf09G0079400 [Salix dunnii]